MNHVKNHSSDTLASVWIADNSDGTYTNNILWADYPDTDVIRVEDTYYLISTSMHLFPGAPILSSKDLIHWKYHSYALPYGQLLLLANEGHSLDLLNEHIYDKGAWAGSLRYHPILKKFYYLVNMQDGTPEEYAILSVADDAAGPWKLYRLSQRLYDPGLLFDDDGTAYVVHGQGQLYLSRLKLIDSLTGEYIVDDTFVAPDDNNHYDKPLYDYKEGYYNEGAHAYKIKDTYYILSTPTWAGTDTKKEICIQTKDIVNGPYSVSDIHSSFMNFGENGIHQGGIVDVPQTNGESEWWSVIFQDRHKLGRTPTLQPVFWEKDENNLEWPMIGARNKKGCLAVSTFQKPTITTNFPAISSKIIQYFDDFSEKELDLCWQWNHIPDDSKWSLAERPGYLRLYTATVTTDFSRAQNTLRQRVIGPQSTATVRLVIQQMKPGDIAGLAVHQQDYNYIGIKSSENGEEKKIIINDNGKEMATVSLPSDISEVWIRATTVKMEYRNQFSYSFDGINYTQLGDTYEMHYGNYVGMGFGVFHFATKQLGGFIDIDSFEINTSTLNENLKPFGTKIEAEHYDNQKYELQQNVKAQHLHNPLTTWTADSHPTSLLTKWGSAFDLSLDNLHNGDWVQYNQVDLANGALNFIARISSIATGGKLEVRLNHWDGPLLASLKLPCTENREVFQEIHGDMDTSITGTQTIYLVYYGPDKICRVNWFLFR